MPIYAAYGTNMHPELMSTRAPHSPFAGTGWLHDWRLTFCGNDPSWEGATATLAPSAGSHVFVALYDVPEEDVVLMDRWEGTDEIEAKKLRVRVQRQPAVPVGPPLSVQEPEFTVAGDQQSASEEMVMAWLYVLDAFEGGLPSARYLGALADAAEYTGAPEHYVHWLRTRPAHNVGPGNGGRGA